MSLQSTSVGDNKAESLSELACRAFLRVPGGLSANRTLLPEFEPDIVLTDNVTVRRLYHYGRSDATVGGSESARMRAHNQLS